MDKYYPLGIPSAVSIKHPNHIRFLNRKPQLQKVQDILKQIVRKARLIQLRKSDDIGKFVQCFDRIIPNEYFGTRKHRKLFYKLIEKILTRSKHECVYNNEFVQGYDHNKISWLSDGQKEDRQHSMLCIMMVNRWLMDNVVKPLVKKHFQFITTREGNKLNLVPRNLWMSFQSTIFRRALFLEYLTSSEVLIKRHEEGVIQARGFVKFFPKQGLKNKHFRPIVNIFNKRDKMRFKLISKQIYLAAQREFVHRPNNIYSSWKKYCEITRSQEVYAVKVDVSDAFGNIDINKLCSIIETIKPELMSTGVKQDIVNYIENQYVYFGWNVQTKKPLIWQWKHGLLQGDWLSSSLCELYMTYQDELHLRKFSDKQNCFLCRGVDDYFFCSTSETDVRRFLRQIKEMHGINSKKTQSNVRLFGDTVTTPVIEYYGHMFHMKTKEVKCSYDFTKGTYLGSRFKFWNISQQVPRKRAERFIKRAMQYKFNNCYFKQLYLNTIFNSEQVALENFYEAMIYLAFKFDAVVMARFGGERKIVKSLILKQVQRIVYHFCWKSDAILEKSRGNYNLYLIDMKLLLKVGYRAFLVVLKKRYMFYKPVIDIIQRKYLLKYLKGLKERGMNPKYFQTLPSPFRNLGMKRRICIAS